MDSVIGGIVFTLNKKAAGFNNIMEAFLKIKENYRKFFTISDYEYENICTLASDNAFKLCENDGVDTSDLEALIKNENWCDYFESSLEGFI